MEITSRSRRRRTAFSELFAHYCQHLLPCLAQPKPTQVKPTEDCLLLAVLKLGVRAQHGAKVVIVDCLLIRHHEVAPPLLARLALHDVLVDRLGGVELGEVALQVLVDLLVESGQTKRRALDFLED